MNESNMPIEIQDVMSRLEFFAQQGKNTKPCVRQKTFVDANTWSGWLFRRVFRESSDGTIRELKTLLREYGDCVKRFPQFKVLMTDCLDRASKGIENLFEIYHEKPDVVSELRVIMTMINLFLDRVSSDPIPFNMGVSDMKTSSAPPRTTTLESDEADTYIRDVEYGESD